MRNSTSTGDATIIQGNKPLEFWQRNQAVQGNNAFRQMQYDRQMEQMRNQNFQNLMKTDLGTPGNFQREQSVNEVNSVRDYTRKLALNNPNASMTELENNVGPKQDEARRRLAKRNELSETFKSYQDQVKAHPERYNLDSKSGLPAVLQSELYDENGKDRNVDDLEHQTFHDAFNHGAVVNPYVRTADVVEKTKSKFSNLELGPEQASALGFFREGAMNKARFMKPDGKGGMTPGVSDELVDYTLHSDPTIGEGFRWKLAQRQAEGAGIDANDIKAVKGIYDDPKFKEISRPEVYQMTKRALEMHQQEEHRDVMQRTGTLTDAQRNQATPDDYKKIHDQITEVQDISKRIAEEAKTFDFKNMPNTATEKQKFLTSPKLDHLVQTIKNGKYTGFYVQEAKPVFDGGKMAIDITMNRGTQIDPDTKEKKPMIETRRVDLDDEATLFDLLKGNYADKKQKDLNWNSYTDYKNKVNGSKSQEKKETIPGF